MFYVKYTCNKLWEVCLSEEKDWFFVIYHKKLIINEAIAYSDGTCEKQLFYQKISKKCWLNTLKYNFKQ